MVVARRPPVASGRSKGPMYQPLSPAGALIRAAMKDVTSRVRQATTTVSSGLGGEPAMERRESARASDSEIAPAAQRRSLTGAAARLAR